MHYTLTMRISTSYFQTSSRDTIHEADPQPTNKIKRRCSASTHIHCPMNMAGLATSQLKILPFWQSNVGKTRTHVLLLQLPTHH